MILIISSLFLKKIYIIFRIDVNIPYWKYQVKPHSSPWFSAACTAAILHGNPFFCLYQQIKSSESNLKSRQASSCCKKKVLEAAKFVYANKTKSLSLSRKVTLNKGKFTIPPPHQLFYYVYDKAELFVANFFNDSNLDEWQISLPAFLSRTNLKLCNISVTHMLVKNVMTSFDPSKVKGIWSWLHSSGGSKELSSLTFINTS